LKVATKFRNRGRGVFTSGRGNAESLEVDESPLEGDFSLPIKEENT